MCRPATRDQGKRRARDASDENYVGEERAGAGVSSIGTKGVPILDGRWTLPDSDGERGYSMVTMSSARCLSAGKLRFCQWYVSFALSRSAMGEPLFFSLLTRLTSSLKCDEFM